MHFQTTASLLVSLAALATAQLSAVPIVQKIAPGATSCADTTECRTAEQAAPLIAKGLYDHGIVNINEMAAVISLMAFESVDFKYKHNVWPGRPGQGTANMQSAQFNLLYAKSLEGVKDKVASYTTTDGLSDDELNHILSLVQPDEYNFGSGPWFLTAQCPDSVRAALQTNVDEGFKKYMACVGTAVTDDRLAYFQRAKSAFELP